MSTPFHTADWLILIAYFLLLLWLSWRKGWLQTDEESYLLSGRKVTLPAFVATLVATWYGGILGVGEYSYQFGISQWLVLGAPYYIFAALFALLLAGKIRMNKALSIPEAIANRYGAQAGRWSAVPIFMLVSPAPYILMLGLLFQFLTGGSAPFLFFAILVAIFSLLYVSAGGFDAVVRTDQLQLILMYGGFTLLIIYAAFEVGGPATLFALLPERHLDITGGHNWQYLLVWFFIALWTFVDPGFHQRAAAAESPATARKGIFLSILFWGLFDLLTLFGGMYGWVLLGPDLDQPALVYPMMAETLLPAGFRGLFIVTLLAVLMSTLDSFLFLSGQTLGRDLLAHRYPDADRNRLTRYGMWIATGLAIILILLYPSVIDLWYVLGSILIPGLLVPVLGVYLPLFRMRQPFLTASLAAPIALSACWLLFGTVGRDDPFSYAFLGIEPFYPGLLLAVILWIAGREELGSGRNDSSDRL